MSMSESPFPKGVHLVGSLPYSSAETAMQKVATLLPTHVRSISDGETGSRQQWIMCQTETFKRAPQVLQQGRWGIPKTLSESPALRPTDIPDVLGDLDVGYDKWALESYETFRELKSKGVVPPRVKFQVGIPTPLDVCLVLIAPQYREVVEPLYEAAILRALRTIQDFIPHEELVVQWELPLEMFLLERGWERPNAYGMGKESAPWFVTTPDDDQEFVQMKIFEKLTRLIGGGAVADDVEVGLHLCYGDAMHKHFIEPADTQHIADVAGHVISTCGRKVNYVHFPVPRNRTDATYLEPLRKLLPWLARRDTYLYVGLVHADDERGTKERIEVAKKLLGPEKIAWGIATECGLGKTSDAEPALLSCRALAQPW